jgi:transposase
MQTCPAGVVAGLASASGRSADLSAEMRFRRGRPCEGGAGSEEAHIVMSDQDHLHGDQQFFGGLDWGGSFHQLCVLDADGSLLLQQRIIHDVDGLALLADQLSRFGEEVVVAIERAEGLLVEFLQTLPKVRLYCVSPKISARARERYRLSASKSDTFDAFVLADTLRHEYRHWRPLSRPSALTAQLQAVSRDRQRVLHAKVACESRLRAVLDTYHPAPVHLFSELDRDITLEFIRTYPTPDQARRVGAARMERFCRRQHYSGRADPQVLVERLKPHLLSASEGTTAGKAFSARLFAEELRMHTDHLRAFDHKISQLLDHHPDAPIFLSFTGIGPVVAATLIAEMGEDRSRFPTVEVLLAETGLAPVTKASGRTRQVRFRYAANRRLRHVIDWWMFIAAREDPWSKTIYEAGRARGQGKYRALRGLGARWVRILWRCWTDHTRYDPARHQRPELLNG